MRLPALLLCLGLVILSADVGLGLGLGQAAGGATAEPVNDFCPSMPDEPVDPTLTVVHEGLVIAFCCKGCRRDFLAAPEEMLAALPADLRRTFEPQDQEGEGIVDLPPVVSSAVRPAGAAGPGEDEAPRWKVLAGRLHPLVVHFPIALLFAALFAQLLSGARRSGVAHEGARFCLRLGTASAVLAVLLGLAAQATVGLPGGMNEVALDHRLAGFVLLGLAVLTLVLQLRSDRAPESSGARRLYVFALLLTAVAVVVTGHLGGTLVFGRDHLSVF